MQEIGVGKGRLGYPVMIDHRLDIQKLSDAITFVVDIEIYENFQL